MKWQPEHAYAHEYILVNDSGEILATVSEHRSNWVYRMRFFIDRESAKRAAEKEVNGSYP